MKILLFDLDGTLIDSEMLATTIVYEQICKRGYMVSYTDLLHFVGKPAKDYFPAIVKALNLPISTNNLSEDFFIRYDQKIDEGIHFFKEVKPVLDSLLMKGYTMAIVSGSNRKSIKAILNFNNATKYFKFFIGIEDSVLGKPDPTGYIMGAKKFAIDPRECIVIEDSLPGIEAGLRAGMKVIAIDRMGYIPKSKNYTKIVTLNDLEKNL